MNENQPLRVTLEELTKDEKPVAVTSASLHSAAATPGTTVYGNINAEPDAPALAEQKASILLQAWFYLGAAGLVGALLGWGIAEPAFVDGPGHRWGNAVMVPLMVAMMCVGFAVVESIVERSARKALIRAGLALPLGIVLGFVFSGLANIFYSIGLAFCRGAGVQSYHNPAVWIARGIAWMVLGAAGGVVYGIIGQSMKKTGYGALGGVIGAAVGGTIFDPISFVTHGGATSRAIGFGLLGIVTGVAIGLVESALKDRWLYVTSGPLAGKQFILYKPQTVVGSSQNCDIYLFKDPDILPQHAVLELKGSKLHLTAHGSVYVAGQPVRGMRVLDSGNIVQLGRYGFRYQERNR
ncbi:FHA domain-containing protein [Silvibacterium acidisoli]|uniref:FHA domain-containing protein n=1 Tax=Acidobacteriaceae bacterium ZG23-2 TaxID=2883246 RepID=UPI00406D3CEB